MLNEVYVSRKLKEVEEFEEGIDERLKKLDKVVAERIGKFKGMDFIPKGIVADFGTGIGTDLISLSRLCARAVSTFLKNVQLYRLRKVD